MAARLSLNKNPRNWLNMSIREDWRNPGVICPGILGVMFDLDFKQEIVSEYTSSGKSQISIGFCTFTKTSNFVLFLS